MPLKFTKDESVPMDLSFILVLCNFQKLRTWKDILRVGQEGDADPMY